MRGEDGNYAEYLTTSDGSPPHARGRLHQPSAASPAEGITPACAGKTDAYLGLKHIGGDHPRMRGEDASAS